MENTITRFFTRYSCSPNNLHSNRVRSLGYYLVLAAAGLIISACSSIPVDMQGIDLQNPTQVISEPVNIPSETPLKPSSTATVKAITATHTRTPAVEDTPPPNTPTKAENLVLVTPEAVTTRTIQFDESSDLLFLSEGNLMRWDHVTNFFSVLVENVVEFSVSQGTNHIVVLKNANISKNGVELFHLAVLDFDSKQLEYLLENTPRLYQISISPDGNWVAYKDQLENSSIFGIHLDGSYNSHKLGACNSYPAACDQMAWSPDGKELLWSDLDGIWLANLEDIAARQVYSNTIQIVDPEGGEESIEVSFNAFNWSPEGRFVLMDIVPSNYGVRWQGILDTGSGRIIQVPETYDFSNQDACATWTEEGSLLVGHSGGVQDAPLPYIDLWQLIPTSNEILTLDKKIDLDSSVFPALPNQDDINIHYFPNWITQSDETLYTFGLCQVESDTTPILYQMDIENGDVNEIIVIPYNSMDILWAPDGSGALILGKNKEVIYAPFDGSLMRDLGALFGEDASDFTWLAPTPRS